MKNGKYRKAATFSLSGCPWREEKSFSQRAFSIYTDIRKLQDKGNSIRTPREIDFVVNLGGKRTYIQLAYVKILDSVNPKSMRLLSEISILS